MDDDGFSDRLEDAVDRFIPQQITQLLRKIGEGAIELVKIYPDPPTHTGYHYFRGVGTIGAKGQLHSKSEQLNQQWGYEEVGLDQGAIFNTATYSAWVQDERFQVSWAKNQGWTTIQSALRAQVGASVDDALAVEVNVVEDTATIIVEFIERGKEFGFRTIR